MQGVIRALLSLRSNTRVFDAWNEATKKQGPEQTRVEPDDFIVKMEQETSRETSAHEEEVLTFVAENLVEPTEHLFAGMRATLKSCDAVLMDMCGHRQYLGPPSDVSDDVAGTLVKLRRRLITFVTIQDSVLASEKFPQTYAEYPEVIKFFAFCRPVHQAATAVEALAVKVNQMQQQKPERARFHPSDYPFWKSLHRTNAQVRHDRGGLTAGMFTLWTSMTLSNSHWDEEAGSFCKPVSLSDEKRYPAEGLRAKARHQSSCPCEEYETNEGVSRFLF